MNFKIFLLSLGLIFFYSSQLRATCINAFDGSSGIDKNSCFKTYAEKNCLNQTMIRDCLLAFSEESFPHHPSPPPDPLNTNATDESSSKFLIDITNTVLPTLKNETKLKIKTKTIEVYCNNNFCPKPPGTLSKIICGKLKSIIDSIDESNDSRSTICEPPVADTDDCDSDDRQCICEKNPDASICQGAKRSNKDYSGLENVFKTNSSTKKGHEKKPADEAVAPLASEDDGDSKEPNTGTPPPLGKPNDHSTVDPFGRGGSQPIDPSSFGEGGERYSAPSASGGTISGSRARVPGARVNDPDGISTEGGPHGFAPGGIFQFPMRGKPGGDGGGDGGGGSPAGSGPRGGGPPSAGVGGGAAGGGSSPSRNRRRRRGFLPKQNTRYMGSPGGGGSGRRGYSPKYSSMNQQVQKKMEENKKKINAKDINTFFQREMRKRGAKGPQSFTPVFYFPDLEKTYEELKDQNQFLNEKGNDL